MELANPENILGLMFSYNPWWQTGRLQREFNKPMRRSAYYEAMNTMMRTDIRRSVILCGARRTGKTTIMYQAIGELLSRGVSPKSILFLSFDHPLLKLMSLDKVLGIYRENITAETEIYCFFDEVQYAADWNSWLKILYDNAPRMRIMATGSASPVLNNKIAESGLGRWKTIHVPTLSFYEYCSLTGLNVPELPPDLMATQIYKRSKQEQVEIFGKLASLQVPFIRYLQVGGFPELALSSDDTYAQRVLREDIIDKALKRDLPSVYGIRNVSEVEKIFVYLCYTSSNIINVQTLSKELDGVSRATVEKYIGYLESANLIYVSPLVNVGTKQLLKAQNKIYIADAAMRNAVLMRDDITNDADELGIIAETAVYKHIKSFFDSEAVQIGYYRGGKKDNEIDIVVKSDKISLMFEVKYRDQAKIAETDAIVTLSEREPNFVITKRANDFGEFSYGEKKIYRFPAPAFTYLLGFNENTKKMLL